MLWLTFALLSALFVSVSAIIEKRTLFFEHAMEFSTVVATASAIIALPFFLFIDYSELSLKAILLLLTVSIIGAVGNFFITRGIRHMDISVVGPMLVVGPAITALLAYFFLEERITVLQIAGILLLVFGAYFLELEPGAKLTAPFKIFKESKYIHVLGLGVLIYSVSSLIDRVALNRVGISVTAYIAFVHLFMALAFLAMLTIYYDGLRGVRHGFKTAGFPVFVIGALTVGHRFFQASAVQIAYVGIVLSIKRLSSVFTTVIGGEIFHEKNILRKGLSSLIMVAGAILIALQF